MRNVSWGTQPFLNPAAWARSLCRSMARRRNHTPSQSMPELLVLRPLLVGKWVQTFFAVPSIKRLTDIVGPRWEGSFSTRNWLSVSRTLSTGIWASESLVSPLSPFRCEVILPHIDSCGSCGACHRIFSCVYVLIVVLSINQCVVCLTLCRSDDGPQTCSGGASLDHHDWRHNLHGQVSHRWADTRKRISRPLYGTSA